MTFCPLITCTWLILERNRNYKDSFSPTTKPCANIETWFRMFSRAFDLYYFVYVNESDPRSNVHYLGSSENKTWKKFRPVRDLNPWPLRYRCSACTLLRGSLSFTSLSAVQIYDFRIFLTVYSLLCVLKNWLDQSKYLSNCTPTPPLIQQKSTDNKLRLVLGYGKGRCTVVQILTLIQLDHAKRFYIEVWTQLGRF